jgi:hypothetical protein
MRRWWQRRSLRLRLTVWYAATSTVILLALGGMVFFVVNRRLVAQLDGQLRGDFELVESRVIRDPSGQLHWQGYGEDPDESEAEQQIDPWVEILSPSGSRVLQEGPSSDWKILSPNTHLDDGFTAFSAETERHLHVRVLEKKPGLQVSCLRCGFFDLRWSFDRLWRNLELFLPSDYQRLSCSPPRADFFSLNGLFRQ